MVDVRHVQWGPVQPSPWGTARGPLAGARAGRLVGHRCGPRPPSTSGPAGDERPLDVVRASRSGPLLQSWKASTAAGHLCLPSMPVHRTSRSGVSRGGEVGRPCPSDLRTPAYRAPSAPAASLAGSWTPGCPGQRGFLWRTGHLRGTRQGHDGCTARPLLVASDHPTEGTLQVPAQQQRQGPPRRHWGPLRQHDATDALGMAHTATNEQLWGRRPLPSVRPCTWHRHRSRPQGLWGAHEHLVIWPCTW